MIECARLIMWHGYVRLDGLSGVGLSTPKVLTPRAAIHALADSPRPGKSTR